MNDWADMKKTGEKQRAVLNSRYDIGGNGILRLFRHQLLAKCIPMGMYRGGAGFKCLLILVFVHYFGRPLFYLSTRYERHAAYLFRLREQLRRQR